MKQKKADIVWTGPQKYLGGRTIRNGDALSMTRAHARLYKALGVATDAPKQVEAVTPAPVQRAASTNDLEALRAQYESQEGQAPDRRWGVARLRTALGLGGPRYQRRDMRAE